MRRFVGAMPGSILGIEAARPGGGLAGSCNCHIWLARSPVRCPLLGPLPQRDPKRSSKYPNPGDNRPHIILGLDLQPNQRPPLRR